MGVSAGGGGKRSGCPSLGFEKKIAYFSKLIFVKFIPKKGIFLNFGFKFLIKLLL